jgi:hypothetical protein
MGGIFLGEIPPKNTPNLIGKINPVSGAHKPAIVLLK